MIDKSFYCLTFKNVLCTWICFKTLEISVLNGILEICMRAGTIYNENENLCFRLC